MSARGRDRGRRQGGGALPALVLALLGGGALWWSGTLMVLPPDVDEARRRLLDARRALLAHVSAYPESYGPGGAGPAHLPCPDTDTPLQADARSRVDRPPASFDGDGPDPPCGSGTLALGRLPRHVSLPSHRELFHHEATQRFVYAVSTRFVNNPPNRVVNPGDGTGTGEGADDAVVAIIADAGESPPPSVLRDEAIDPHDLLGRLHDAARTGGAAARPVGYVLVRRDALLAAAARRVAAWFVETATRVARRRCASGDGGGAGDTRCPRWPDTDVAACAGPDGDHLLVWLADDPLPESGPESEPGSGSGSGSGKAQTEPTKVPSDSPSTSGCAAPEAAPLPESLENTPRERHWFVRNGWHRFVSLAIDPVCRSGGATCGLRVVRGGATTPSIRFAPSARERRP